MRHDLLCGVVPFVRKMLLVNFFNRYDFRLVFFKVEQNF